MGQDFEDNQFSGEKKKPPRLWQVFLIHMECLCIIKCISQDVSTNG